MDEEKLKETLNMSDEEFMQQDHYSIAGESETSTEDSEEASGLPEADSAQSEVEVEEESTETEEDTSQEEEDAGTIPSGQTEEDTEAETDSEDTSGETEINYKEWYEKATSSFKADGKQIEVKTPEELIQLAQMGMNYTRKMQSISQHKKLLMTLEQNGMLSPEHISYLVDINNKNPEALKKLVKESGIDVWDLTDDEEVKYTPQDNIITDSEAALTEVINENFSLPYGQDTLNDVKTWDMTSKKYVEQDPSIIAHMREQRESGVYDIIMEEANRMKRIGTIPFNEPFLDAYVKAGNSLAQAGGLPQQTAPTQQTNQITPQPIGTRVGSTGTTNAPNNRARNAAPPKKIVAKDKKQLANPFTLSDEEFLKSEHLYMQHFGN